MNLEDLLDEPPPPAPLPVPRYDHLFTGQERQGMQQDLLQDLADESILIRSRMQSLFQAALQETSPARLTRIVDLYSRAAVRLGRLILHRHDLHRQRFSDPETSVRRAFDEQMAREQAQKQLEQLAAIRSSKNHGVDFFIENPLTLSPYQRIFIEPLLYPGPARLPARGRPSVDLYAVVEGILHKLLTGIPWYNLPVNYPSYTICCRHYRIWLRSGLLDKILFALSIYQFAEEQGEMDSFNALFSGLLSPKTPLGGQAPAP
jgi:hypothetical protein